MRHFFVVLVFVSFFLSACSPATPGTTAVGMYPLDTKTGVEEIDQVLAVVAGGNPAEVRKLIRFTSASCTTADGLGGPPKCLAGEAEGTVVEVLPLLGAEGGFIRKGDIGKWAGIDVDALYAVYRISKDALHENYYPPGEYLIIFAPKDGQTTTALRIAGGGIVRIDTLFGEFPDSIKMVVERDTSEVILAPEIR